MEVAQQRSGIRIVVVDVEGILEEIGGHKDQTLVPGHAAQPQVAINVVGMLLEDLLVQLVGHIVAAHGLVEPGQVVLHGDLNGLVVLDILVHLRSGVRQG